MMPFAPQVDRSGSVYLSDGLARWQGDAAVFNQPEWLVFYSGATNALPVLTKGGVITLLPRPGDVNPYVLLFRNLLEVNIVQGNATLTKHKTRIECRKLICQGNEYYGTVLTQRSSATAQWLQREYIFFDRPDSDDPTCLADCLKRATDVVNAINADPYAFATATLITEANTPTTYSVEIEAKVAGRIFDQSVQGFTQPDILVQAVRASYTAGQIRAWYGAAFLDSAIPDTKAFTIAEVQAEEIIIFDNFSSSSNSSPHGLRNRRLSFGIVLFDETVTNSAAALAEFIAIVDYQKAASLYHSRLMSTASNPAVVYPFTIAKTDAGDVAAFNTAQTAYGGGANGVKFIRASYENGKSYYTTVLKVNTAPTPINASGDVVEPGNFGADDTPCLNCQ